MLDSKSNEPLTSQLEKLFMQKIEFSEWTPSSLIPSELTLAKEYAVSRTTVHWALLHLQALGLVYRIPGKGTAVTQKKQNANLKFSNIRDQLAQAEWSHNFKMITCQNIKCPAEIASILHTTVDAPCLYVERLYYKAETKLPIMLQYSYLAEEYIQYIDIKELSNTSIHSQLQQNDIFIVHTSEWLEATGASKYESKMLQIPAGTPVLLHEEHRLNALSEPYYVTKMITRGDYLRLSFTSD